jgi:UDP-N-acetylenolpyruvoylglucosamine reductase
VPLAERQKEGLAALGLAEVRFDEPLGPRAWLRIGGPADAFVVIADLGQLRLLKRWCRRERLKARAAPLGPGLLIRDGGLAGVAVVADPAGDGALRDAVFALDAPEPQEAPASGPGSARLFLDPRIGLDAGRLLAEAGLAGVRLRGARICEQDANLVLNEGEASARDVVTLIDWAKRQVAARTGVTLAPAVVIVGRDADDPSG